MSVNIAERTGPLADLLVVDLTRALAGPQAGMMLGDMGARVIKIENAGTGDDTRTWGDMVEGSDGEPVSTYFLSCNRNKESVTADLKSPEGAALLTRLVQRADVLMENFRPGVMDRLGFSITRLHELNPRLVILSVSGFGHDGPEASRPGYDQIAQGEAGLMSLTGPNAESPTRVGVPIGDLLAGMNGAFGVLTALYERERTGKGRVVRTSLLASIVAAHSFQGTRYTIAGKIPQASGNQHGAIAPYGLFRCADGAIQAAVATEEQWHRFAHILNLDPTDPRYTSNTTRVAHRDTLKEEIENVLAGARASHWLKLLHAAGIPAGEVRTLDQVYSSEQVASQGLILEIDHPTLGTIKIPGSPLRFDGGGRTSHQAPPRLGEHNDTVQTWLDTTHDPD